MIPFPSDKQHIFADDAVVPCPVRRIKVNRRYGTW